MSGESVEGLAIVGEVTVGFPAQLTGYGGTTYGNTEPTAESATWLRLRADGTATAYAGKVEYGQGIRWGLAVEVADELRMPLDRVAMVLGDTDEAPWDMGTFGSQSTARVGVQLRKAAATAREVLLGLAADRLDLPVSDLQCVEGRVVARGDGAHGVDYGELLAGQRLEREIDEEVELTTQAEFTVMGGASVRIDATARVTGEAVYSRDVLLPDMLFAQVLRPPSYGAKLASIDWSVAEQMPGVARIVRERVGEQQELVAVLAESDDQAELAARVAQAQWDERGGQPSRWDVPDLLKRTAQEPFVTQEAGDLEEGFRAAEGVLEATTTSPTSRTLPWSRARPSLGGRTVR